MQDSHTLFEKVILKFVRRNSEEITFLNARKCVLRARHDMMQCVRLTDCVTLNFYNAPNMAVFMDNRIACDTVISNSTIFGLLY